MMNAKGGFAASESYAWPRYLIERKGDVYDPRVRTRILRGEGISAADYIDLLDMRRSFIARMEKRIAPYDALVLPTTANTPPKIADFAHDKAFTTENLPRPAQLHADQHARRLRDLTACASRKRGAGRPDAGGRGAGHSDRRILNSRPEWRASSVFDLTFTIHRQGRADTADASDRPGRDRRLDRS